MGGQLNTILYLARFACPHRDYSSLPGYIPEHARYHAELRQELGQIAEVISSDNLDDLGRLGNRADYVVAVYNDAGFVGAESYVAAFAERFGIAYMGARPAVRGVAEDKHLGKLIASRAGLHTPNWTVLDSSEPEGHLSLDNVEPPYFIKPRYGRNSEGIDYDSLQRTAEGAELKSRKLARQGHDLIIEHYVHGIYCTVPVWTNRGEIVVLPPVIEKTSNNLPIVLFDQKTHAAPGLAREVADGRHILDLCQHQIEDLYRLLMPLDYARFDFIYDPSLNRMWFLELNICCSLSKRSTFFQSASTLGYSYSKFISTIIKESAARQHLELRQAPHP